jgi:hypothetical protein
VTETVETAPLPPAPPPHVAIVAQTTDQAREWVALNAVAFVGVDVKAFGVRVAGITLRGQEFDRVYVVSGSGRDNRLDLNEDPLLETALTMSLLLSGGEMVRVSPNDRIRALIVARCDDETCRSAAQVVVRNVSGVSASNTPSCPQHAARYVGSATEAITPIALSRLA